jgi:V8-like Glu-specific endopeptidase
MSGAREHARRRLGSTSLLAFLVAAAALLTVEDATAQNRQATGKPRGEVLKSWTAEEIARAQPMWRQGPTVSPSTTPMQRPMSGAAAVTEPKRVPGFAPKVDLKPADIQRSVPMALKKRPRQTRATQAPRGAAKASPAPQPFAFSPAGAVYSQSRVWPPELVAAAPYRATGKLFGRTASGGPFTCTASVIAPRLVVTAGHCLYDNSTGAWARDFVFAPAYDNGVFQLGLWTATGVVVTPEWVVDPRFPHPADVGILVMADQAFPGTPLLRIGDVTGGYGYALSDVFTHRFHVDFLGYPGNLDLGEIMQRTGAQTWFTFDPNSAAYGSDQQHGSSGGPYVIDLQMTAIGGIDRFPAVVGVESGGDSQGMVWISLLGASFQNILGTACAAAPGNC